MKIDIHRSMIAIIQFFVILNFVSCGVGNKLSKGTPISTVAIVSPIPYNHIVPVQKSDTSHKQKPIPPKPTEDVAITHAIQQLSTKTSTNDSLNQQWQKVALRAIDYAHQYHVDRDSTKRANDSIMGRLNHLQATTNAIQTNLNTKQKVSQETFKMFGTLQDWCFGWIMFMVTVHFIVYLFRSKKQKPITI